MRKMAPPATPCVHHSNPSGIEPRIIATLIAASYLMLLFAISRQAIFLESTRNMGQKIGRAQAFTVLKAETFTRSDKKHLRAMKRRRENRFFDSENTTVYSDVYTAHAFLLPFSFHLMAQASNVSVN